MLEQATPQDFWPTPKMWEGETVYIIGGGKSLLLAAGLPCNTADSAAIYPAISEYLKPIHGQRSIGG